MRLALQEAQRAKEADEVPVGAVLVHKGEVIARAHNLVETLKDATAHAEMLVMREGAKALNSWRLEDCTLYVTLEPCAMCAGAAVNARLHRIVFGAFDQRMGCCGSALDITDNAMGIEVEAIGGILEEECAGILSQYFKEKRK